LQEQRDVLLNIGMLPSFVEFVLAMESGRITGDVVIVDEDNDEDEEQVD